MKRCLLFLVSLMCFGCFHKKVMIAEGGGMNIDPVPASLRKSIQIAHFHNTTCVVFPSGYAKKHFESSFGKAVTFFDPDTFLIKKISQAIIDQYCGANKKSNFLFLKRLMTTNKSDSVQKGQSIEFKRLVNDISYRSCLVFQGNSYKYDKQFIGYIKNGERIIYINLIDFTKDPHQLKPLLTSTWLEGWHGWFYSNIIQLQYHISKNMITIGEDI